MSYKIIFLYIILFFFVFEDMVEADANTALYGPYRVKEFDVKLCEKSMKPQGPVETIFEVYVDKNGHHIVNSSMFITQDIGPLMSKTVVYKKSDGKYAKTLTMNQANVCQYAFPLKFLPYEFKVDSKCFAKAANYTNNVMDADNLALGLLGKKSFYGAFKIVFEWYTKKQTVVCAISETELAPLE